jgi:hypothetical protein
MHFTGTDVFVAAPIVWFNAAGQVAAVGACAEASACGYRRVDLVRRGDVLAETGELGRAAELFLRYSLSMAVRHHPLRSWLRPEISYAEDGRLLTDGHTLQRLRFAAFCTVAQRVRASSVHIAQTLAA